MIVVNFILFGKILLESSKYFISEQIGKIKCCRSSVRIFSLKICRALISISTLRIYFGLKKAQLIDNLPVPEPKSTMIELVISLNSNPA